MADAINNSLGAPLTVMLLAMIPIAEARVAIPFGMTIGLHPAEALGYAFLGSSLLAPILLLVLIPIINALSRTKFFSKIGKFLYDKFEKKSRSLANTANESDNADIGKKKKFSLSKSDLKKMGGTAAFVAIPLPLTGVWTGSAVASIVKVGFVKGLIGVIVGNAAACGIITLISFLFAGYEFWITLGFAAVAVIVLAVLIIKLIVFKPHTDESGAETEHAAERAEASLNDGSAVVSEYTDTAVAENEKPPKPDDKSTEETKSHAYADTAKEK